MKFLRRMQEKTRRDIIKNNFLSEKEIPNDLRTEIVKRIVKL